ncbi:uncharacterized protein LOC102808540 [Saccoglossus kowalevskii]|uniref:DNA (Cytosine-5)-methyltransferase PliMCI-like n=1 Tax=Saccoglossus kowalevskii TaxID=10224 RepID=A0ABM0MP43_SACKO|nr:PREDICTED: DNA (cytosine-5)-methyltransferase PliMCI-like [Saccoglossus kowalevskii]
MPSKVDDSIPEEVRGRLAKLQKDYEAGSVKDKNFAEQKSELLLEFLPETLQKSLTTLKEDLKDECLTEKGYCKKVLSLLSQYLTDLPAVSTKNGLSESSQSESDSGCQSQTDQSTDQPDGDISFETPECTSQSDMSSKETSQPDEASSQLTADETSQSDMETDQPDGKANGQSMKRNKGRPKGPQLKKKKSPARGKTSDTSDVDDTSPQSSKKSKIKKDSKQPNIALMFAKTPSKRKTSEQSDEAEGGFNCAGVKSEHQHEKRMKIGDGSETFDDDEDEKKFKKDLRPKTENDEISAVAPPVRCTECRQLLDDPDLKTFPGDPDDSVDEFIMLTDPRLSLFTGDEEDVTGYEDRPQHKLTNFRCVQRL